MTSPGWTTHRVLCRLHLWPIPSRGGALPVRVPSLFTQNVSCLHTDAFNFEMRLAVLGIRISEPMSYMQSKPRDRIGNRERLTIDGQQLAQRHITIDRRDLIEL